MFDSPDSFMQHNKGKNLRKLYCLTFSPFHSFTVSLFHSFTFSFFVFVLFTTHMSSSCSSSLEWLKDNRAGLAFLSGKLIVPSQFFTPSDHKKTISILQAAFRGQIKPFELFVADETYVRGVVVYPFIYDQSNRARCVINNHGNATLIDHYWHESVSKMVSGDEKQCTETIFRPGCVPDALLNTFNCPIVLYDYRVRG